MSTETKIDYKKIILITLLKTFLMFVIIFFFNCWPQIKQSLSGKIPPLNDWLDHSLKMSNLYVIVLATAYFYFTAVSKAKLEILNGNQK